MHYYWKKNNKVGVRFFLPILGPGRVGVFCAIIGRNINIALFRGFLPIFGSGRGFRGSLFCSPLNRSYKEPAANTNKQPQAASQRNNYIIGTTKRKSQNKQQWTTTLLLRVSFLKLFVAFSDYTLININYCTSIYIFWSFYIPIS